MDERKATVRLLLVDDEPEFLHSTAKVLARRGLEPFTAGGGAEAIALLRRQPVDVVVLDMKMPGMDGAAVFDEIKRNWPGLPVIVLTGHESLSEACAMTKEGVVDYLLKPCDIDLLAEKIQDAAVLKRSATDVPGAQADAERDEGDRVRVLLVDDEPELLDTLKKVLTRRGMEVHTTQSGEDALRLLQRTPIDVIVLDVKMPGMSGLDVLRQIKQAPVNREVILLTGHPTVDAAVAGLRQGAFEYLIKPPDVAELVTLIRRAQKVRQEKLAKERQKTIDEILRRYPD